MQVTEEYLKDHFLTAYFIDNERQNIEIQATSEDQKKVYTYVIPFDENRDEYKALSKFMSLDQLHESTYQRVKNERRLFEEQVIRIAQKDGLIMDSEKIDTKFYPTLVTSLFEEMNCDPFLHKHVPNNSAQHFLQHLKLLLAFLLHHEYTFYHCLSLSNKISIEPPSVSILLGAILSPTQTAIIVA